MSNRRSKAHDVRAVDVEEYIERVRKAQPSLDSQLATYRERRRSYEEMRARGSRSDEVAAAQNRRQFV